MSKILYRVIKRVCDISIAIFLWILLSPLLLLISLAIKITTKGPIFAPNCIRLYKFQPFFMYKFRTMYSEAEDLLEDNPDLKKFLENDHKIPLERDIRVTPIGKFLRKTDFNEIPQLINIILGNMSLVGPRPYMIWEIEDILNGNDERMKEDIRIVQKVKPGLTGLWQVSGRNLLNFEQRVQVEAMYVRNRGFLLDLKILLKTPLILISGRGRR
ncbi:MAG: sugar transferase [Candidatus Dojkabacteria bacterium]|nr:sugar transferase [Candidatus Dojkabacteria bacterium]